MNAKSVVQFILMRPAFTTRNLTSIFLVCVFVAVYILAGGRVTTVVPNVRAGAGFGGAHVDTVRQSAAPTASHSTRSIAVPSRESTSTPRQEYSREPSQASTETAHPERHHNSYADLQERLNRLGGNK